MTMGKFLAGLLVASALFAGFGMYYLQVYAFYEEVAASGEDVQLLNRASGQSEPIVVDNFQAIDGSSSPIRYRACFSTNLSHAQLRKAYVAYDHAEPRNAPGWFDCFDAQAIADELKAGTARAFMGAKNIAFGVDRIVTITKDGRGYVWHEPNECGAKAYDGSLTGEECPARASFEGGN